MRTTFPKSEPHIVHYRDQSKFNAADFCRDLENELKKHPFQYDKFEQAFLGILELHAPQKSKVLRANHKPYVTKEMRKAIMHRSKLQNRLYINHTPENLAAYKKQKNYCNRLYKRTRKEYLNNLNVKNITDNKKFWRTVKPFFTDKGGARDKIVLVEEENIINNDAEIAQTFNDFFDGAVKSLGISENEVLLTKVEHSQGKVLDAIKEFESHPSILKIKENVIFDVEFSFKPVSLETVTKSLKALNRNKAFPFMNIPPKILKDSIGVIDKFIQGIWNNEILTNKTFPRKLKLADITPIHKKLSTVSKSNYRPISVLAVVSKVFEGFIDEQTAGYIEKYLSRYLCGYRKDYSLLICEFHIIIILLKY